MKTDNADVDCFLSTAIPKQEVKPTIKKEAFIKKEPFNGALPEGYPGQGPEPYGVYPHPAHPAYYTRGGLPPGGPHPAPGAVNGYHPNLPALPYGYFNYPPNALSPPHPLGLPAPNGPRPTPAANAPPPHPTPHAPAHRARPPVSPAPPTHRVPPRPGDPDGCTRETARFPQGKGRGEDQAPSGNPRSPPPPKKNETSHQRRLCSL